MVHAMLEAAVGDLVAASGDVREPRSDPAAVLLRIPEVVALADAAVASWHSANASLQSRRYHRAKFDKPLLVTPLDDRTELAVAPPFAVNGHDISLAGLSFVHDRPLAPRKVAVTFHFDDGSVESLVTLLKWCRFRRDGFYQSGGQFLRRILTEVELAAGESGPDALEALSGGSRPIPAMAVPT